MEAFKRPFRVSEYLLLFAGVAIFVVQPWLTGPEGAAFSVWVVAKFAYVVGVTLYVLKR